VDHLVNGTENLWGDSRAEFIIGDEPALTKFLENIKPEKALLLSHNTAFLAEKWFCLRGHVLPFVCGWQKTDLGTVLKCKFYVLFTNVLTFMIMFNM
jgi:hypothetical protein